MQCDGPRRNAKDDGGGGEECNVKVVVRVRPLVARERLAGATESLEIIPGVPQIVVNPEHSYSFDQVFGTAMRQENIFDEAVRPVLDSFLEGYNCTILAYGQTGSGKTFTMGTGMGLDCDDDREAGIIPRAVKTILSSLASQMDNEDRLTEFYVSFLEIYNEDIVDLLNPAQQKGKKGLLAIREDAKGEIYIAGIKEEKVASKKEVLGCLHRGSLCRTTKSTQMNMVSSRSHAIFTLVLRQRHRKLSADGANEVWESRLSKLHFVDLAGSERLKRTQAVGDRAKESININGGLLALGNVISALGDESKKGQHVPYRDSKLTRLLQDSLGGNSRTLMIACVSPSSDNLAESLNTLKYAHRARNIKNRAVIGDCGSAGESGFEIAQLKKVVSGLRQQIQQLRASKPVQTSVGASGGNDGKLARENAELRQRLERCERAKRQVEAERDSLLGRTGKARGESPVKRKPLTGALRKGNTSVVVEEELPTWFNEADSLLDRARTDVEQAQLRIQSSNINGQEEMDVVERVRMATKMELAIVELQSDLSIKQDLIHQIEASKQEYLYMRERYEERLKLLQESLRGAQEQRDQAIQQHQMPPAKSSNTMTGLREGRMMRERYEERIKRLGKQVNELKDAIRATNHSAISKASASDTLVRNLRANLTTVKGENSRLQAQLAEALNTLKTAHSTTDNDLRDSRLRERKAMDSSAKWKKAHDFQKSLLRKRVEQVMQARSKIRQLVGLLRRHRVDIGSPSAGIDLQSPGWKLLQGDEHQSPLLPSRLLHRCPNDDPPMEPITGSGQESPLKPKRILSGLHASVSAGDLNESEADSDLMLAEATSQMALDSSPFEVRLATPKPSMTPQMVSTAQSILNSPVGILESLPKSILRASPLIPRRRDFFARLADANKGGGPAVAFSFPDTPVKAAQQKPKI